MTAGHIIVGFILAIVVGFVVWFIASLVPPVNKYSEKLGLAATVIFLLCYFLPALGAN